MEVQATAERTPLSRAHLDELLALAAAASSNCGRSRSRRSLRPRTPRARVAKPSGRAVRLLLATHNEHKRREFERLLPAG